jgi:hypothetical protein
LSYKLPSSPRPTPLIRIKAAPPPAGDDRRIDLLRGSPMAFMMVLLVFLLGVTVWAYFHTNPPGAARGVLALYNAAILLAAVAAGLAVGRPLYLDAVIVKGNHAGMPTYLSVMGAGTVVLIVLALGGVARNFFVFPTSNHAHAARD